MRIERQIAEALRLHTGASRRQGRQRAMELLKRVGFQNADVVLRSYPHELSGGMRQRVAIAMALACVPKLLMADEPTSALDATVQAQVIGLLKRIQTDFDLAILFVTHDLQLVSHVADRVIVMYAGRIVESGPVDQVIGSPQHAYTRDLLGCVPSTAVRLGERLAHIPGSVPDLLSLPSGCSYNPRCALATDECRSALPSAEARDEHSWSCHHPGRDARELISGAGVK
jgi:oligopeptide/dipeptide ABC transporter ATP-binding protein